MIRPATPSDSAAAVPLLIQAIGNLAFVLSGTTEGAKTAAILKTFFEQEGNRISYQNSLVMEKDGKVIGLVILYPGAKARKLDIPIEQAAAKRTGDPAYRIPTEPEGSEFYLDTVSVNPDFQGKGYGRKLIEAGCELGRDLGFRQISLLVHVESEAARRLYERLGFAINFRKWMAGEEYLYLVRPLS